MTLARDRPPGNVQHLERLIGELARELDQPALRLRTTLANTIVGQMLPEGAVKGGSAMKLRLGAVPSRFSSDLDFARRGTLQSFEEDLTGQLQQGWSGFTGRLVPRTPAKPAGVPASYVMRPFEVKLEYKARSWCTVILEVGHDEIGDTDDPDMVMAAELADLFVTLGLDRPTPQPVLAAEHQIAQKLHASSCPGSDRAHDLVDLQLLMAATEVDLTVAKEVCERLFAARQGHAWPPTITAGPGWDTLYEAAADGVDVSCAEVTVAVDWANGLVEAIAAA